MALESTPAAPGAAPDERAPAGRWRGLLWAAALALLIAGALGRSALATRLDGFTIDEPLHLTAGVSYVRTGDYRLNPEHPPLVKLWVGAALSPVFKLPPWRTLTEKSNERRFTAAAVYLKNNPDEVQRRVRMAMLAFHGLLLLAFALAAARVFGRALALAALGYLAIDPTVAAHLPVVMTDLPVTLLAATAALWALVAFRTWRPRDLAGLAVFLGLTLAAKHSALVMVGAIGIFGLTRVFWRTAAPAGTVARRLGKWALVMAGAWAVLWGFYRFRFDESPAPGEVFNRPLPAKISDVQSPVYRGALEAMAAGHLMPRAYVWGLADTVRAGVEGRGYPIVVFGKLFFRKAPLYFFPGVLLVKIPIGLTVLTLLGLGLLAARRLPPAWRGSLVLLLGFAGVYMAVLVSGSPYAGIRHALPVVPVLALFGGAAVAAAWRGRSALLRGAVMTALAGALLSALPVLRPWEYYNELIGGPANACRLFNDEGIGLGQRTRELAAYYNRHLRGTGERFLIAYSMSQEERQRRHMPPPHRLEDLTGRFFKGTILVSAQSLAPNPWWDLGILRRTPPAARFGSLLVFRGTFDMAPFRSEALFSRAIQALYSPTSDPAQAERLLAESVALDPGPFFVALELGNVRARRGDRQGALQAYALARSNAPPGDVIVELLDRQMERVSHEPPASVPPLRNPIFE